MFKNVTSCCVKIVFFCQFNVKLLNLSRQWPAEKANNGQLLELQVGHFISQFHVLFLSVALGGLATQPTTYMLLGEPLFMKLFFIASSTWSSLHHSSFVKMESRSLLSSDFKQSIIYILMPF